MLIFTIIVCIFVVCFFPAKVKEDGDDVVFCIPHLFIKKRKKKSKLESYQITFSMFPIRLYFTDGTELKWTSLSQWNVEKTKRLLDSIIEENHT